jgi:hypothetical protein
MFTRRSHITDLVMVRAGVSWLFLLTALLALCGVATASEGAFSPHHLVQRRR